MSHWGSVVWKKSEVGVVTLLLAGMLSLWAPPPACAGDPIRTAGDVLPLVLSAAGAGLSFGLGDREGTWQLGESLALTLGATYGLKYTVREKRPTGADRDSFPSGHTSVSFCAAEFLRKRYGWEYGLPAYAVAAFVGYSRVESRQHYVHDVVAGAALGAASSYLFTRPYEGWTASLDGGSRSLGLRLSRVW